MFLFGQIKMSKEKWKEFFSPLVNKKTFLGIVVDAEQSTLVNLHITFTHLFIYNINNEFYKVLRRSKSVHISIIKNLVQHEIGRFSSNSTYFYILRVSSCVYDGRIKKTRTKMWNVRMVFIRCVSEICVSSL